MRKNKDLKRLKRSELLELMLQQQKEVEELKEENIRLNKKLAEKKIRISESGNLADVAVKITKILEETQKVADIYLEGIRFRDEESTRINEELTLERTKSEQKSRIEKFQCKLEK
ncbi:MAG: hypothetical protein J6A30_07535 [Ruminococcus sp.]|nr:hypothetical protein [Ruminococcus sp.]